MIRRVSIALLGVFAASAPCVARAQRAYPVDLQVMPITQNVRRHQSIPPADPTSGTGTLRGIEGSVSRKNSSK